MAHPVNPQYDPDRIPIGQTEEETPEGTPRWVFIERASFDPTYGPDVYIGPFTGPNADEDAATCMNESSLVDGTLQPAGGGGTDCFVTINQPGPDDETWYVDFTDGSQTGIPQTPETARICIHNNKVWFGHECGLCDDDFIWKEGGGR